MPKPACLKCQRFYRPKKNGFIWCEGKPIVDHAAPGTGYPEKWEPYKIWSSDLWECDGCGNLLITGHGQHPIAQDYREDTMKTWMPHVNGTINDC